MTQSLAVHRIVVRAKGPSLEREANAYLIHFGAQAILIDAGFAAAASVEHIASQIRRAGVPLQGIYLTHAHPDHAGGAFGLAEIWHCPVHVAPAEQPAILRLLAGTLPAGDTVRFDLYDARPLPETHVPLLTVESPGHTHGHVAFFDPQTGALWTGDAVLPDATVWIGPPDGHVGPYLHTLDRLAALDPVSALPGHGPAISDARAAIRAMKTRRLGREREIADLLSEGEAGAAELVRRIYGGRIPPEAMPFAERTVRAHLQHLAEHGAVTVRYDRFTRSLRYRCATPDAP
jgi:ribonuclease/clavin/mitogillin